MYNLASEKNCVKFANFFDEKKFTPTFYLLIYVRRFANDCNNRYLPTSPPTRKDIKRPISRRTTNTESFLPLKFSIMVPCIFLPVLSKNSNHLFCLSLSSHAERPRGNVVLAWRYKMRLGFLCLYSGMAGSCGRKSANRETPRNSVRRRGGRPTGSCAREDLPRLAAQRLPCAVVGEIFYESSLSFSLPDARRSRLTQVKVRFCLMLCHLSTSTFLEFFKKFLLMLNIKR